MTILPNCAHALRASTGWCGQWSGYRADSKLKCELPSWIGLHLHRHRYQTR